MSSQNNWHCQIFLTGLFLLLTITPMHAFAECDYEPDAVDCPCFSDIGIWDPGGAYIQDVAIQTVDTRESCPCPGIPGCNWDIDPVDPQKNFQNGGKPYYQMVLGCDEPFTAFSMAILLSSGADFHGRSAWCSESVSYWHKHAYIPYPGGYRNDWHQDWQVYNAKSLVEWYAHEGLLEDGRGRFIFYHEVDYENFELGVTVPVPGAYIPIRGFDYGSPDTWRDWNQTGHSLIINEMWVHTDALGTVFRVEVSLLEGNNDDRVRDDNGWDDILSRTPQGSTWLGGHRKIFGFGIDLDADGNPIYDPARLHYVSHSYYIATPPELIVVSAVDPQWDEQFFQKVLTYASLLRANGGPKIQSSSVAVKAGGIPDGQNHQLYFPSGLSEPVEILIDLLYSHPYPIKGIELRWDPGFIPPLYSVQFAGADQQYQDAQIPDLSNLVFPGQATSIPVPVKFSNSETGVEVRYVKLVFPAGVFQHDAILQELRFDYDKGPYEDAEFSSPDNYPPNCSKAYAHPCVLWPPNFRFSKVKIKGVTDPEGDPLTMLITGVTQDEPLFGRKYGWLWPDAIVYHDFTAWLRAERSGFGNGRVYEISFIASDDQGNSCEGSVNVTVPHSKKKPAVNDGQLYDSDAWLWYPYYFPGCDH